MEYQGLGGYSFFEDNARGQTAYELLNARVGYERAGIGVSLFAKNLEDTGYFPFALPGGPGGAILTTPGEPRTFGIMVSARF